MIGRTLGLYFGWRFLTTVTGVFATVFLLIYTIDFVELMRRAGETPQATTALLAKLALYRTPAVAEQILPFAMLFGAMIALLNLSRRLELVVARAAGISAWQFLTPAVLVALLLGFVVVGAYNPISARLKQRALTIETTVLGKGQTNTGKDLWIRQRSKDGQAIIRADRSSGSGATLGQVSVFEFDRSGAFIARVEARRAELKDGYWQLADARVTKPGIPPESFETYLVSTNLSAAQVRESILAADTIPFWELPHAIENTERAGFDPTRYRMQYQTLTARPLMFVAMVLVAASVSLRFFRFGGVAQMVLYGIGAGFMLYVATKLVEDLGSSGLLSTAIAAWSPAVIGSLLGTLALLYQEDG